jgi:tRNA uridine 5-carboxymethylaminomethyl modification enzyme
MISPHFDVIVVGGGHAGVEAALASARLGLATALVTIRADTVGVLSCNPAFGGQAKGTLVREVDALGGWCGMGADRATIHRRILGESKGPASRATRAMVDRTAYSLATRGMLAGRDNPVVAAGEAARVLVDGGRVRGLALIDGRELLCGALVLTGGTFWNGRMYNGLAATPGGRFGEAPATLISASLASLGHRISRLSTSTAPRLDARTVETASLEVQPGDPMSRPFSALSEEIPGTAVCHVTWTTAETRRIVLENIKTSKIYCDEPAAAGPRYCPSLEDKFRRFPHRERHLIHLEPDGPDLVYPSGLPTGLAPKVQQELIRTIPGLASAVVARPGYAIEYDVSDPRDLEPTLESRLVRGLFLAGQVNGTSGYEEAAAQGLWAGLSAARRASGLEPVRLGRDQALLGVMLDDLTVMGVAEPYRMYTARAERRLTLREDNADLRLSPLGDELGALDPERRALVVRKREEIERFGRILEETRLTPSQVVEIGAGPEPAGAVSAADLLKRPWVSLKTLEGVVEGLGTISEPAALTLEIEVKYQGYLARESAEARKAAAREGITIPPGLDWRRAPGLSSEAAEALERARPSTIGQAGRLRGVTPAAIGAVLVYLRRLGGH